MNAREQARNAMKTLKELMTADDYKVVRWYEEKYDIEGSRFTARRGAFYPACPREVLAFGVIWSSPRREREDGWTPKN